MPKKDAKDTKKAAPKAAKASSGGAKKAKKKWSKGNVKDKLTNKVIFDQETYDKLLKEVPSYKLITPSVVSDRMKINGSLARRAVRDLEKKGLIKRVAVSGAQSIYTRAIEKAETAEPTAAEGAAPAKKGGAAKKVAAKKKEETPAADE